jgi:hypothetical protein
VLAQRGDRHLTAAERTALLAVFRSYVAPNGRKDKA